MLTLKPVDVVPIDEHAVLCAEHNTTFYTACPRAWGRRRMLRELAGYFRARGHEHRPFETIELTPISAILPRLTATPRRPVGDYEDEQARSAA